MASRKRKRERLNGEKKYVYDVLIGIDSFTPVRDYRNRLLWYQADLLLQKFCRDLLDKIASRWSLGLPLPRLTVYNVEVRDDTALLPALKPESRTSTSYARVFLDLILDIFEEFPENAVYVDFCNKLGHPKLDLLDLQNLYFHKFLQSFKEITDFIPSVVDSMRFQIVYYKNQDQPWSKAYEDWGNLHYGSNINLAGVCKKHTYAWRAFEFRTKAYEDTTTDELELVRDFLQHFNQCRMADKPRPSYPYNEKQKAQVVFSLFPHVGNGVFDFFYECKVYLDVKGVRIFYKLTR